MMVTSGEDANGKAIDSLDVPVDGGDLKVTSVGQGPGVVVVHDRKLAG